MDRRYEQIALKGKKHKIPIIILKFSRSIRVREASWRFYFNPIRMAIIKETSIGEDMEKENPSSLLVGV